MTPTPRPVPVSTYRLQLTPDFGFAEAIAVVPYLASLGVTHLYLSPVLDAVHGSAHGYDVVDHSRVRPELGGADGLDRLVQAARSAGLGLVVDVVPNHMAVPTPASDNHQLWSVLRDGPQSPYAHWFDIDWSTPEHALLMPVLGQRVGQCVDAGEIVVDRSGPDPLVRYFDHVLPVRPGTEDLALDTLLERQWYRLAYWRVADEELNYRRFFDIDTLAAVRVEDEDVFDATHDVLLRLVSDGTVSGLRIDHPDGLADPRGYLRRLADRTGGAWVVVEKILEGDEELPADWPTAGTTGYDALGRVGGLFVDPAGSEPLRALMTGITEQPARYDEVVDAAKRLVVATSLRAEVAHLVDLCVAIGRRELHLRDHTTRGYEDVIIELLVAFEAYRAYVVPGEDAPPEAVELVDEAASVARSRLADDRHDTLDLVVGLALGRHGRSPDKDRFVIRFQQACGPVMAKGVEDTAGYRWPRLVSLNEVGGDPEVFGVDPATFHAYAQQRLDRWPTTMTTLSTHDTKRAEDVRARLAVISERPDDWALALSGWRSASAPYRPASVDPTTEHLVWQTLVGAWPIDRERMWAYVEKAVREAKIHTAWTDGDPAYEHALHGFVDELLADDEITTGLQSWVDETALATRADVLGQKLVQLTMPGVPDVYQGCELTSYALVDPDNRRPVDYPARADLLAALDRDAADQLSVLRPVDSPPSLEDVQADRLSALGSVGSPASQEDVRADQLPALDPVGSPPSLEDVQADRLSALGPVGSPPSLDAEKLLVTSRALRLRRDHPAWFGPATDGGSYDPLAVTSPHAVGFVRGGSAATLVTRLPVGLAAAGGFGDATVALPPGRWTDLLTSRTFDVDPAGIPLADLLTTLPVALLVRA